MAEGASKEAKEEEDSEPRRMSMIERIGGENKSSELQAYLNVLKSFIGIGILATPGAMAQVSIQWLSCSLDWLEEW